jgi:predicted nicotinamide N-methyase
VVLRIARPAPVPLIPEVTLLQADEDMLVLWQRLGSLPFWAVPWPGGQALARYLLDHPAIVRGRRVLDLASGSGLVALAAGRAGAADITAADTAPLAQAAIRLNAAANGVQLRVEPDDLLNGAPTGWDVVLVGDACYEVDLAAGVRAFTGAAAAAGALVLIGDPGRTYLDPRGLRELARLQVPTPQGLERGPVTTASVWQVLPPDEPPDRVPGEAAERPDQPRS